MNNQGYYGYSVDINYNSIFEKRNINKLYFF